MKLQEEFFESDATRWRRSVPWLHLWRVFGIALDARKILFGMLGLGIISGVSHVLPTDVGPVDGPTGQDDATLLKGEAGLSDAISTGVMPRRYYEFVTEPPSFDDGLHGVICLVVFSIVGVAICRIAALEFVTGSRGGFLSPIIYAGKRLQSSLSAVFIPVAAVAILAGGCGLFGLLFRLPGIGLWFGYTLGFVPYFVGIGMTVMLIGIVFGWPLMLASIATDGSDGFDALSRSYNYTFARLGQYLLMSTLCLIGGVVSVWIVSLGATVCSELMNVILASGSSGESRLITEFWSNVLMVGVTGYVISYAFSSATIIYFLLRKSVDATPLDRYFMDQPNDDDGKLPLVGMAERARHAKEQTAAEKPDVNDMDDSESNLATEA